LDQADQEHQDRHRSEDGEKNLDQLKDKISKVIVMVLVVGFFKKVGLAEYTQPLELLCLALSITAISVGLYFLGKVGKH